MAKTSTKSKKPVSGARKAKPATRNRKAPVKAKSSFAHEDHVDGCDVEFLESQATIDADLPPAAGGVESAKRKSRAPNRRA